jgi:hypothetical protein
MASVGSMNFFQVNECGLYKIRDNTSHGLKLADTFSSLHNWRKTRSFVDTIPWDPSTRSSKSKCYCKDIHKDEDTGDFLVVLWKSDTDSSGGLLGAEEDEKKGDGDVIKFGNEHKGKKIIWGRPCYYWIIPSLQSIVSIKFDHSVCDSQLFQEYVAACVNNRISFPDKQKEQTEHGFTRISFKEGDAKYRFAYRFDMSLRTLDTANSELVKLAQKVTHIIKRETFQVRVKDERAAWLKIFNDSLPFVSARPKADKRRIELKVEAKPTVAELQSLIQKYGRADRKSTEWDNVGFQGEDGATVWVDSYRLREEIVIGDVHHEWYPAKFLFQKLNANRSRYVTPIKKSVEDSLLKNKKAAVGVK